MPTVLVIDDDPGVSTMVAAQLEAMGIETITARDGRVGLRKLCERTAACEPVDAAIVDLVMPEVDGWQVLKAIKHNPLWEHIKVIVISGYADTPTDLLRIIEFDGVFVEKRAGFVDTVGDIVKRVLEM